MRIFVAGATGFVGRHLVRALAEGGHRIQALVRPSADAGWPRAHGADVISGDVADRCSVERAIRGCEVVYNLATPRRGSAARVHEAVDVVAAIAVAVGEAIGYAGGAGSAHKQRLDEYELNKRRYIRRAAVGTYA